MKTTAKKTNKGRNVQGRVSPASAKDSASDIYERFTQLIIQKLEEGVVPWKQPWHELGLPANYLSKKPYKGINLWILLSMNPIISRTSRRRSWEGRFVKEPSQFRFATGI